MRTSMLLQDYYDPITCNVTNLDPEHQRKTTVARRVSILVDLQLRDHQNTRNTYAHGCKRTTTGEAWESPCSPPILPAAPLPSLIHPHQGPECLLSLSAPHCLLSFRVPCSPLWGHLVFGVGFFFFSPSSKGVQGILYSDLFCKVKVCFSGVTLLTSWPLIDWINARRDPALADAARSSMCVTDGASIAGERGSEWGC